MVPSTYEAGKLYNVLPSGNRAPDNKGGAGYDQTRADFDFDRGSNAAATRINSSGLIEKYRENIFVQSNQFDTTWLLASATITGGQSGYDGTNNAWKLQDTAVSAEHFVRQTPNVGNIVSVSVYAKANTLNFLWLRSVEGGVNKRTWFDLSSGSVGTSQGIDANIESVGNGWYRCSATFNHQAAFEYYIAISDANGSSSYTGDGTGSIYIQSAQLESGLCSTEYLNSTSVTGKAGVLVDLPRINYDANGENGALLLEPSRQNRLANSENGYGWVTSNVTVLPFDGGINGKYFQLTSNGSASRFNVIQNNWVNLAAATYTASVFAKKGTTDEIILTTRANFASASAYSTFNLTSGTVANNGVTGSIEPYSDGWYRCSITFTNPGSYTDFASFAYGFNFNASSTDTLFVTAPQSEIGNYSTSYIPTMGTAQTRAADSCSVTGASDVIGQTEGTMFAEINFVDNNTDSMFMTIGDGTSSNRLHIGYDKTSDWIYCNVKAAGFQQALITSSSPSDGIKKIAVAYKQNDYIVYINGVSVGADTNANVPSLTRIDIGGYFSAGFEHSVKQNLLFKERLTNAELATLTTL